MELVTCTSISIYILLLLLLFLVFPLRIFRTQECILFKEAIYVVNVSSSTRTSQDCDSLCISVSHVYIISIKSWYITTYQLATQLPSKKITLKFVRLSVGFQFKFAECVHIKKHKSDMDFSWLLAPEAEGSHTFIPGGIQVSSYPRLLVRAFSNPMWRLQN